MNFTLLFISEPFLVDFKLMDTILGLHYNLMYDVFFLIISPTTSPMYGEHMVSKRPQNTHYNCIYRLKSKKSPKECPKMAENDPFMG